MKNKLKSKFNFFLLIIVSCLVLYFSLKDDFSNAVKQILSINPFWFLVAIVFVLIYYFLRSYVLYKFIRKFDDNYKFSRAFSLLMATVFFDAITPFATGGQPYQIYALKKDKIKITDGTNIIIQNFIVYQIALVLLGLISIFANSYFHIFPSNSLLRKFVTLGFLVNFVVTVVSFLLAFMEKSNNFLAKIIIGILAKLKIVKDKEERIKKWKKYINNFHGGAVKLLENKVDFIKGILINFVALTLVYLIPLVILFGMRDYTSVNAPLAIIASSYVMLIGSFVPIPGGTGGLEYSFMSFYSFLVKDISVAAVMILWRFVTYYFGMIIGAIFLNFRKAEKNADRDFY